MSEGDEDWPLDDQEPQASAPQDLGAVLALDFGTKRLGMAVTDRERRFHFPRDTLLRSTWEADLAHLSVLCDEDQIELLVVGYPLNADGSHGPMARKVREFAARLSEGLSRPHVFVDERYSSLEAEERLRELHPRDTRKRKALRDRGAAVVILRTFLDHGPITGLPVFVAGPGSEPAKESSPGTREEASDSSESPKPPEADDEGRLGGR